MNKKHIQRFKEILLTLREQVRGDIASNIDAIVEEMHPAGDNINEPTADLDKEFLLEHNEEDLCHKINEALQRIEDATY